MNTNTTHFLIYIFIILGIVVVVCGIIFYKTFKKDKEIQQLRQEIEEYNYKRNQAIQQLSQEIEEYLQISDLFSSPKRDEIVKLKSSQAVDNYDAVKFFCDAGENWKDKLDSYTQILSKRAEILNKINDFLHDNPFQERKYYSYVAAKISKNDEKYRYYIVDVFYISPAGRSTNEKTLYLDLEMLKYYQNHPELLMTKGQYSKYQREQAQQTLEAKRKEFYEKINELIDYANDNNYLLRKEDKTDMDDLISALCDKPLDSIRKIKTDSSDEWTITEKLIHSTHSKMEEIIESRRKIYEYYNSDDFANVKNSCAALMSSQREFNEYIEEKVNSIASLFGTRVLRNETDVTDEYHFIRPYKKTITPFTAEVSSQVFASAENSPMQYVIKYFYPDKEKFPEQIQKLQFLIEELETLKDAKRILETNKISYQKYLTDVPDFVLIQDEAGFYAKLGFADISENKLTVEYKFVYTSNGGKAQRSFTIPMTEETIKELIKLLQGKLTQSVFAKEQRDLMTSKLRQSILQKDNYTCRSCGNSIAKEPNLLLEVDHIIPVSKGGYTVEGNLQTLCWKCNRKKSNKVL